MTLARTMMQIGVDTEFEFLYVFSTVIGLFIFYNNSFFTMMENLSCKASIMRAVLVFALESLLASSGELLNYSTLA